VQTFPGSRTVTYAYDNTGRRSQILYPDSKTVDYTYDEGGRMKTVTDWLSAVTEYFYNNAGMLDHTDYANGVTTSYGYDTADRLTSVVTTGPGPTTIASATYTLDDAGIRTAMVAPGGTTSYQYDDLYRLTRVDYPGSVFETFDYDETGNRIQRVTTDYAYNDADQLTSATTGGVVTTYTNDNNGNMTGRGSDSFTYDHENRLTSATVGMNSFSATYDGDGLRATSDGTTWTWDAARGLPQVLSDGSTTYVYGLDLISKTASGGARRYYAQDGLGTTVALSNTSGTSVGTAQYYAYGEQRTATGESAAPFEFAGEQRDASTGLYYLRARYYDPDAGRFITKDPWGGSQTSPVSLNPYAYSGNSPVQLIDPSGMCALGLECPGWAEDAGSAIVDGATDIVDGVADTVAAVYPSIAEVAGNVARDTANAVAGATKWLKNAGCLDAAMAGLETLLLSKAGPLASADDALRFLGDASLGGLQTAWQPSQDFYEGDVAHRYDVILYKAGVGLDVVNLIASTAPLFGPWGVGVAIGASGAVALWNGGQCLDAISREVFGVG